MRAAILAYRQPGNAAGLNGDGSSPADQAFLVLELGYVELASEAPGDIDNNIVTLYIDNIVVLLGACYVII